MHADDKKLMLKQAKKKWPNQAHKIKTVGPSTVGDICEILDKDGNSIGRGWFDKEGTAVLVEVI